MWSHVDYELTTCTHLKTSPQTISNNGSFFFFFWPCSLASLFGSCKLALAQYFWYFMVLRNMESNAYDLAYNRCLICEYSDYYVVILNIDWKFCTINTFLKNSLWLWMTFSQWSTIETKHKNTPRYVTGASNGNRKPRLCM